MSKKILTITLLLCAFLMIFAVSNKVEAETKYGTVESLMGSSNTVSITGTDKVVVKFSKLDIKWSPADPAKGRNTNGWWIGIKITAPEGMTDEQLQKSTFVRGNQTKKFWDVKDSSKSPHYFQAWSYIDNEKLKSLDSNGTVIEYYFDWDNSGEAEQTVSVQIDTKNITLDKSGDVVSVVVDGREFTLKKEQTLDNLPDADKQELEKMKTPKEGQKYLGLYYADGTKFDESSKINNDIELHIKFENIKTEEPATPSNNNVKDATPKTGTVDMIGYATILAIVSAMGIVILNKKH